MKNIFSIPKKDLEDYFISINDKKFRATQIYEFLYKKRIYDVNNMNNIGKNIKEQLKKDFDFSFIIRWKFNRICSYVSRLWHQYLCVITSRL